MSGGAYDHLHQCPPEQLCARLHDVQRMADRLVELGYTQAADETLKLEGLLRDVFTSATSNLREVWRAVEWLDSGDWTEAQVQRAAENHRLSMSACTGGADG